MTEWEEVCPDCEGDPELMELCDLCLHTGYLIRMEFL